MAAIPAVLANPVHAQQKTSVWRHPFKWIAEKVKFVVQKIFGYLLRLSVFQLGEYKRPLGYVLMRAYQRATCNPREEKPVSRERLERSKNLLLLFGGVESVVIPQDGKADVRLMTFKASEFFHRIEQLGGQKIPIFLQGPDGREQNRFALVPIPGVTPKEFEDLCKKLEKFSLSKIEIATPEGMKTGVLLPESPQIAPGQPHPMVVRFHSPGRSMVMDRKFIGLHLGAGYDICISDPRATIDSTGVPSEGGYYLDAEAVLKYVLDQGYPHNRIWISGYCEGAAIGAHLKRKYHAQGIHFIAENPFNSLLDTILTHNCLGRYLGRHILPEIQSTDPAIARLVVQDGFDNAAKFRGLAPSLGKFVVIHTNNDRTDPKHSVPKIREAIGNAGPYFEILRRHPNPRIDGHMQPPIEDPAVWRRYVEVVV